MTIETMYFKASSLPEETESSHNTCPNCGGICYTTTTQQKGYIGFSAVTQFRDDSICEICGFSGSNVWHEYEAQK